ncbi:MAG: RagB/SusD family nutrient uptake outer membrane protein [Bacteroidetes bacterium]|nr:RagB/SusD family nutrient uptake outer membrane protein [Bacteroidota bacterium]
MKKHIYLFWGLSAILFLGSCNESSFLDETTEDFLSADIAYSTTTDFDYAVNELHYLTRYEFYCNGSNSLDFFLGCDLVEATAIQSNLVSDYATSGSIASAHWSKLYKLIGQANTIISRLPSSSLTADEQAEYMAKAKFFRGFAYRCLAYEYGGVPLQLEEVTSPKYDYTRASRKATVLQAISDVKYAAQNLPDITDVDDGEISSPAAYHLLSELYLAAMVDSTTTINTDNTAYADSAISAATTVINNSSLGLMTSRFGSAYEKDWAGDVYFDLFRLNNQNRSTYNNIEGLWVIQIEAGTTGGGADLTSIWSNPGSYLLDRYFAPQTGQFTMTKDGTTYAPFTWPIADYTGTRGIGSNIPTDYYGYDLWGGKGSTEFNQDIRNSNYNFVRKFKFNNTSSSALSSAVAAFGSDTIDVDENDTYENNGWTFHSGMNGATKDTKIPYRCLTYYQTKCTTLYDETPSALLTSTTTYTVTSSAGAGGTFTDQYMFRLAETYLLRAEAYLYKGDYANALADINTVRSRSNAPAATEADLAVRSGGSIIEGLDYLLDERLREFGIEEKRRLTLGRLGSDVFVERVKNYNPFYYNSNSSDIFTSTYAYWPIPLSVIEANVGATLNQNPGY